MSGDLQVEVRVTGRLAGDLLAMLQDLKPRVVPRHTAFRVDLAERCDMVGVMRALERAGVELDRITT